MSRVSDVTKALIGFQVGTKVRVTMPSETSLPLGFKGKIFTIRARCGSTIYGDPRWTITESGNWCKESCMEPVWDENESQK